MNDEAGFIDPVIGRFHHIALQVDFHQVRCGDFVIVQPVWVDQKVRFGSGHVGC